MRRLYDVWCCCVAVSRYELPTCPQVKLPSQPSHIRRLVVRGVSFDVKRDDQWRLSGEFGAQVSGNKARKLLKFALDAPSQPGMVASMGGHQSNAMVALAALCHARGLRFVYLVKPVPRWLRSNPAGNYARALALNAELVPLTPALYKRLAEEQFRTDLLEDLRESYACDSVTWIPQGGACADAECGLHLLADEIMNAYSSAELADLNVVLPAGTGTTALFLARHLKGPRVLAVPCATSAGHLRAQMEALDAASGSIGVFPTILDDGKTHRFGQPIQRDLDMWNELRTAGLFVDLVYAPHTWNVLLETLATASNARLSSIFHVAHSERCSPKLLYLHCGGIEGVATQLTRYRHVGLL